MMLLIRQREIESSNSRCNGGGSWLINSEGKAAARTRIVRACAQAMWSRGWLPALPRTVARFPTDVSHLMMKYVIDI